MDSVLIDSSLPGSPALRVYSSANDNPLGISVGYADLYGRNIATQRIDVTGLPSGPYWLEVFVDPNELVQETDDSNNIERILVDLTIPTTGDHDQDTDVDGGDFLFWQTGGSPNSVTTEDFNSWLDGFGTTYPPPLGASIDVVPEPQSLLLLGLGGMLVWSCRKSRNLPS